jgi:hypothetical protein
LIQNDCDIPGLAIANDGARNFDAKLVPMPETEEPPSAQLLLPRPHMSGLIFAAVVRDTRSKPLPDEDRFNFFPASPFCSVSWIFEGQCYLSREAKASTGPDGKTLLPELLFSGPNRAPGVTWNPAAVFAMTISFYPEAWQALTGLDLTEVVDRNLPLESLVSGELLGSFRAVFQAGSCEECLRQLEDALNPLWNERRRARGAAPFWFKDWVIALSSRAVMSGTGKSMRQLQRHDHSFRVPVPI